MAKLVLATVLLGCCSCAVWSLNDRLREVFSWRQVDFEFPDQRTRQAAIASGEYVQANNLPLGLEVWRDKLFITVPRWKAGVASTLNYVPLGSSGSNRNHSPALIPYPSYEMNQLPTRRQRASDHIVNTFRLSVDHACDRLWVIDMGQANGTRHGPPQLFVIDLNTDRVIRQFTVTAGLMRPAGSVQDTWFPGLIADSEAGACDRSFAYMPDLAWGLVVYSFRHNAAWRLEHPYFYFDPMATVFNIGGVRLEWLDGAFGVALSARHADGYRTLYFHSMASTRMFSVNTRVLQANRSAADAVDEFRHHGHRLTGMQAGSLAADTGATGALFYALVNQDAIGCWNPGRSDHHGPETTAVLARDPVRLNFPADVKVDAASNVWVLSDRMPRWRFRFGDFDLNDVNYRVFSGPAAELVRGTVCEPTAGRPSSRPTYYGGGGQAATEEPEESGDQGWSSPGN
uniref:Dopachrome conversion enzyme n=1 Tax=Nipponaphis monzeni TaxID=196483 RepID=A0A481MQJ7_9HEMI